MNLSGAGEVGEVVVLAAAARADGALEEEEDIRVNVDYVPLS
jgi:hypothetical protein